MKSFSKTRIEVRRCRPLLGTFVEVTVAGPSPRAADSAVIAAFRCMERLQNLWSVHDPRSEISQINATALHKPVRLSCRTYRLIRRAHRLAVESEGVFDYTTAPILARWGLLPPMNRRTRPGTWRDIEWLPERRLRFLKPLAIDLGGIAKGAAVDAAIGVLKRRGIESAMINAGGDLRLFGPIARMVHLRHPAVPGIGSFMLELKNQALASSSPIFTEKTWQSRRVSHLVHGRTRQPVVGTIAVSVAAPECWIADALTKIVLAAPPRQAEEILKRHRAWACVCALDPKSLRAKSERGGTRRDFVQNHSVYPILD